MASFYQLLNQALDTRQPFALGIISTIHGSSPQKRGAKAIFFADGTILGTLGGGCLEAEIQDRARRALSSGKPGQFDLVLDHDFGWDDGLICGGRVAGLILPRAESAAELWRQLVRRDRPRVWGVRTDYSIQLDTPEKPAQSDWLYRETVAPPCSLWIAGAGHVAQAVAPLAHNLDFDVVVLDDRPALAHHSLFPAGTRLRVDAWERLLRDPIPHHSAFGLVVTRGHQHDALVLRHWISQPFEFLGMIGSRRKRRLIFDQFIAEGIATAAQLARVACPVGLAIDAVSVQEIGVSIVAQLIQARAARGEPAPATLNHADPMAGAPAHALPLIS